ncbi:MAG: thioredoxin [Chlamydiota bacterium]|nr:thioredoxin [Chlamydiota bacterium]
MAENLLYLNDDNFDTEVASGVTLVDFYADWCGPCRMIAPIFEELSNEMHGKAKIAKVDIEAAQNVTANFGVTSIPTIILFKDGKEIERVVGVRDKAALQSLVENAL